MHIFYGRCLFMLLALASMGCLTAQEVAHPCQRRLATPPPFEKIYVGPNDLMTTPQGCYYVNRWGEKEKVCAVLNDCYGCYVIKITRQCPVCGRCCNDTKSPEGYDCPFGKVEIQPHVWADIGD